jgi:chromosome segregation ATPase
MEPEVVAFLNERFGEMNERFGEINAQFGQINAQFGEINAQFGRINERFDQINDRFGEVDRRFDDVDRRFNEVDRRIDEKAIETRRHFDVVAERLESKVELLAEGFRGVDHRLEEHRAESDRAHREVMAMVRLSYRDLRRRVNRLARRRD